ncbi:MAG TPA: hypothetical protein DCS73_01100 [Roseburia sp.]|nr:hypothetical protein [Roseburia sp.]
MKIEKTTDERETASGGTVKENGEKIAEKNTEYFAMLDKSMEEAKMGKGIVKTLDEILNDDVE